MMRFFPVVSGEIIYWKIRFPWNFKYSPTLVGLPIDGGEGVPHIGMPWLYLAVVNKFLSEAPEGYI